MKVKEIQLSNFRNYNNLTLKPNREINIFLGKNASGKTNILEAISMLISGKSFRTSRDRELIQFDKDYFQIDALIEKNFLDKDYYLRLGHRQKKDIKINLSNINTLKELRKDSPLVVFMPEDLEIIKEGPSLRRKFFDEAIGGVDKIYKYNLSKYNKILSEKNELLKFRNQRLDQRLLFDAYNIQLASIGAYLIHRRKEYLEEFNEKVYKIHQYISEDKEEIHIKYVNPHVEKNTMKEIEAGLLEELREALKNDLFRRTSTKGPQRDEYDIFINDILLKQFGSQGQQRSTVLSMKLTELNLSKKYLKTDPILLLDDVFSELDKERRKKLIDSLEGIQVFISMAEERFLKEFEDKNYNLYIVNNGKVKEMNGGKDVREQ